MARQPRGRPRPRELTRTALPDRRVAAARSCSGTRLCGARCRRRARRWTARKARRRGLPSRHHGGTDPAERGSRFRQCTPVPPGHPSRHRRASGPRRLDRPETGGAPARRNRRSRPRSARGRPHRRRAEPHQDLRPAWRTELMPPLVHGIGSSAPSPAPWCSSRSRVRTAAQGSRRDDGLDLATPGGRHLRPCFGPRAAGNCISWSPPSEVPGRDRRVNRRKLNEPADLGAR
jgi:hypothetical protein